MLNFGQVPSGAVLPIPFSSYAGSDGASATISDFLLADVRVYKGTSMTQRASTSGIVLMDTDGIDLDGITGINGFSIDTGDNADAGFYSVGGFFWVVVTAITVDTETVNFLAANFRLGPAETTAGYPVVISESVINNVGGNVTGDVTGDVLGDVIGSVNNIVDITNIVVGVLTTAMTQSYSANGAEMTLAQAHYQMFSRIFNSARTGTTLSAKELDGTTEWGTCELDSATAPTSIERTS
jgi:hypothetical protein